MIKGCRRQIDALCVYAIGIIGLYTGYARADVLTAQRSFNALRLACSARTIEHGVAGGLLGQGCCGMRFEGGVIILKV